MRYTSGNAQSVGLRAAQEDAFGFSDPGNASFVEHAGFLGVLADGMGGLANGDIAGRAAVRSFLRAYESKTVAESIPDALWRALVAANGAVMEAAPGAGATLVATVLHGEDAYWITVGDSALFQLRGGEITQLNRPHVYSIELDARVSMGEISREQALADPQREALTSHLGMAQPPYVDRNPRPLRIADADTLLLASDGLFKTVPPAQFPPCSGGLQEYCEALVRETLQRGLSDQDNVTVLALRHEPKTVIPPAEVPAIEAPPIAPAKRWLSWVAILAVLAAGIASTVWIARIEMVKHPAAQPSQPSRELGPERYDNKKIPGLHEAREP